LVDALRSFGLATLRYPATFRAIDEEILREILLVILKNQFEPAAGELFSRCGKTDIAILGTASQYSFLNARSGDLAKEGQFDVAIGVVGRVKSEYLCLSNSRRSQQHVPTIRSAMTISSEALERVESVDNECHNGGTQICEGDDDSSGPRLPSCAFEALSIKN
jgi:hypothetical protein